MYLNLVTQIAGNCTKIGYLRDQLTCDVYLSDMCGTAYMPLCTHYNISCCVIENYIDHLAKGSTCFDDREYK